MRRDGHANNREDGGWQHNEGGQEGAARTAAGARARAAEKAAAMASPTSPTTADGGGDGGTDAGVEAPTEAGVAEEEVWRARSRGPRCPTGSPTRWRTRCVADGEDESEAGEEEVAVTPLLDAHGPGLSYALRYLRRRLKSNILASRRRAGRRSRLCVARASCIRRCCGPSS